jgi:hypothetical protein
MDNPGQNKPPPLIVWIVLIPTVAILFGWIYFTERSVRIFERTSRESFVRDGFQAAHGKAIVLIFGTSLVESGLAHSDSLGSCVEKTTGQNTKVIKYWQESGVLSSMIKDMPVLQQVQPSLVVIEANMLFYRGAEVPVLTRYGETFRDMMAFKKLHNVYQPDLRPVYEHELDFPIGTMRSGMIDSADLISFRNLAERWQSGGTRFLLVNFPIEKGLESRKWKSSDTAAFKRNIEFLKKKISLEYADPQLSLDSSYFFDKAHLNDKGSIVFCDFFCRMMARQLKKL